MVHISIEDMEALHTTHDEGSRLLNQQKQSLRTEYGHTAEFCSSFFEMTNTLSAFNLPERTAQWQASLDALKQILSWFFAFDQQNYARYMWLYFGEMSQLPETYPEKNKELIHLKVQSCKLYNNKYMIASTQITNTEILAFISVLVLKSSRRKALFTNRKRQQNIVHPKSINR